MMCRSEPLSVRSADRAHGANSDEVKEIRLGEGKERSPRQDIRTFEVLLADVAVVLLLVVVVALCLGRQRAGRFLDVRR